MFFKSYKQKSFDVGVQIRMLIELPFFSERIRAKKENREFLLPKEMFEDAYVLGFFTHFVAIMLNFFVCGRNARNWSKVKIGAATIRAFDAIDPTGNLVQQSAMSNRNGVKRSQAYLDGGEAAATLYYCIGKSRLTSDWDSVNFSANILEEANAVKQDMAGDAEGRGQSARCPLSAFDAKAAG